MTVADAARAYLEELDKVRALDDETMRWVGREARRNIDEREAALRAALEADVSPVDVLQRFLLDGRTRAWTRARHPEPDNPSGYLVYWDTLARDLDDLISQALDNDAGWNVNQ